MTDNGISYSYDMLIRHLRHQEAEGVALVLFQANNAAKQPTAV